MVNDYGVFQDGTNQWVKTSIPLVLSSADQAKLYSEADAMTVANYLSQGGTSFKVGRPGDRQPH